MNALSILIPEYNCDCTKLVHDLCLQCKVAKLPLWEIIVADDGSSNKTVISKNSIINTFEHCSFIQNKCNMGRSAIRNFLANKAQYNRLLFIDSDMCLVSNRYILNYMATSSPVVYGGYCVIGQHRGNLRYEYEKKSEHAHRASERQKNCYKDFHTSNYCIDRNVLLTYPLDSTFQNYGYEDVAYGALLCQAGIPIQHINNPVGFCDFETNESYIQKVEESLRTLFLHRAQLQEYSRIITIANTIERIHLHHFVGWLFGHLQKKMREQLIGHPRLTLFSLYKIGYYVMFKK